MRAPLLAALLCCGCFDLNALDGKTLAADMSGSANADLTGSTVDLAGQPVDLYGMGPQDLTTPIYWVRVSSGGMGSKPLRAITGAGGTMVAVGDGSTCLTSPDGNTWMTQNCGSGTNFTGVWGSAANDFWLVAKDGQKFLHYDGNGFAVATMVPGMAYSGVYGISAANVFAVGDDNMNVAQLKMGLMWKTLADGLNVKLHGTWGMTMVLWVVGENSTAGYYDFSQGQFNTVNIASANNVIFNSIWGTSDTDVWTVGMAGNIAHYKNGAFQGSTSGSNANLNGVWGLGPSDIWAVGTAGTILHYNGATWAKWTMVKDISGNENLQAIWGNGSNLWAASDNGSIYRYK